MVNLAKIDWLALLAMDNAIRLHGDALALFREGRYPSAFLLSVLAQEEIGKAHTASKFVWLSKDRFDRPFTEKEQEEFVSLLYKHPHKQSAFLTNSSIGMSLLGTEKGRKMHQDVFNGSLEAEKQKATYVGLKRYRGKIELKGHVSQPLRKVSRDKADKQISMVHDHLVDACVGIISNQYDYEISNIKRVFNRRLYKQLIRERPVRNRSTKKWIKNIEKFLHKEKMKPL